MSRNALFLALAAAFTLTSAGVHARPAPPVREAADLRAPSPVAEALAAARAAAKRSTGPVGIAAAPTIEEVGDADSFGHNVRWLGLLSGYVQLAADCSGVPGEPAPENCVSLAPAPAPTTFSLSDLASITLPGRSSESLLCHWQTPIVSYYASNPTAGPGNFQLRVTPVYTIENEVLNEVIDPNTGVPYPGSIQLGLTNINRQRSMAPGDFEFETITGTRMCIGGLVSRESLVQAYGFTPAQARKFFRKPITIRLGIQGTTRLVDDAVINIGTRFTGDATP